MIEQLRIALRPVDESPDAGPAVCADGPRLRKRHIMELRHIHQCSFSPPTSEPLLHCRNVTVNVSNMSPSVSATRSDNSRQYLW